MFTTINRFRHQFQFTRGEKAWTAVELTFGHPLFILGGIDSIGFKRRWFLGRTEELLLFTTERTIGQLVELQLLQPPHWAKDGVWSLIPIEEVLFQEAPPDGSRPSAVVRGIDGVLYGGFPIARLKFDTGPLRPLATVLA
jgi:hypothetical protein